MKKIFKLKYWHIAIVMIAVALLSILSWTQFISTSINKLTKLSKNEDAQIITANPDMYKNEQAMVLHLSETFFPKNGNDEKKMITKNTSSFEKESTIILQISKVIDKICKKIDSSWSIYKEDFFCKTDSRLAYFFLNEVVCNQVLEGKNHWLFYKSKTDGDPIADYEGTNTFSVNEMNFILEETLATQTEIEKRGTKFLLLVIPNKSNVYSEFMPDYYRHSEISRTDVLLEYLTENGVNAVSPKKELIEKHLDFKLYYSYDTHWNKLGAYVGTKETLKEWNIEIPDIKTRTIVAYYDSPAQKDLAELSNLSPFFDDDFEYGIEGTTSIIEKKDEGQYSNKISHYVNKNAPIKKKLMLVGDSFAGAMTPILSIYFEDVYAIGRKSFQTTMLDIEPDFFIVEYVERFSGDIENIRYLIENKSIYI